MLFDKSGPTCLWKWLVFITLCLYSLHSETFSFEVSLFSTGRQAGGGRGLDYPFAWLLNWVISLHLHSKGSVAAVGQQSSEMKDTQLLLPLVTVQPDTGSHSWQRTQSICEKLSGCTLNQSVCHLKPRPISAVTQHWAVGRRCLKKLLSWLSSSYHRQTTPVQQSNLTSNPVCCCLQHTGPQMNVQDSSGPSGFGNFFFFLSLSLTSVAQCGYV